MKTGYSLIFRASQQGLDLMTSLGPDPQLILGFELEIEEQDGLTDPSLDL